MIEGMIILALIVGVPIAGYLWASARDNKARRDAKSRAERIGMVDDGIPVSDVCRDSHIHSSHDSGADHIGADSGGGH